MCDLGHIKAQMSQVEGEPVGKVAAGWYSKKSQDLFIQKGFSQRHAKESCKAQCVDQLD